MGKKSIVDCLNVIDNNIVSGIDSIGLENVHKNLMETYKKEKLKKGVRCRMFLIN